MFLSQLDIQLERVMNKHNAYNSAYGIEAIIADTLILSLKISLIVGPLDGKLTRRSYECCGAAVNHNIAMRRSYWSKH